MIITLKNDASLEAVNKLVDDLKVQGFEVHDSVGENYHNILLIGDIDWSRIFN